MNIGKSHNFYVKVYSRHSGVTGSCFLNSIHWPDGKELNFMVDCGAAQGKDNDGFYNSIFPFDAEKIDFAILTHAHLDHYGLFPAACRQGFIGPIFTHYANNTILNIGMWDTCQIKDKYTDDCIASKEEVEATLDKVVGCTLKKVIKPHKNVRVVFYSNGHIIGAVITLIVISYPGEEDITLIYTGDYKDQNAFFNVEIPPEKTRNLNISAIFIESTYGNVDSTDSGFKKCVEKNLAQALKDGKTVIAPAFALGRTQEVLYDIKRWKNKGSIPENTKIYLDGRTAQEYTYSFIYNELGIKKIMKNFLPNGVTFIPQVRTRNQYRQNLMERNEPKIIVATGGMASYGPVQNYINYYLSKEDALIHLLGYCSPETQGYKLLTSSHGEKIMYNGKEHIRLCDVARTAEYSGHAPRNKLLNFLNLFPYKKSIVINHGEEEVKKVFREYVLENTDLPEEMIAITSPEYALRIESKGIVDRERTNFESVL